MELSNDQKSAISQLFSWYTDTNRKPYITLGGYAGTGKTTVIAKLRDLLPAGTIVGFCAYTGKAVSVLKNRLISCGCYRKADFCGTIHSMIYEPILENDEIIGWKKVGDIPFDLVIVDESSMVTEGIFNDLMSYNKPIICIGDHGQLPPVADESFNLMMNPDIRLETVHRFNTTEDAGLLKLSIMAREEGKIPYGTYGDGVLKVNPKSDQIRPFVRIMGDFSNAFCICATNKRRIIMNGQFRRFLGRASEDVCVGDRVICLRNNKNAVDIPIYNGMLGTVKSRAVYEGCYDIKCLFDNETKLYKGLISKHNFNNMKPVNGEFVTKSEIIKWRKQHSIGDYFSVNNHIVKKYERVYLDSFEYGYAITCHKSQGSEMENVMVIEERNPVFYDDDTWRRWLYTAVTRSRKRLLIVG